MTECTSHLNCLKSITKVSKILLSLFWKLWHVSTKWCTQRCRFLLMWRNIFRSPWKSGGR